MMGIQGLYKTKKIWDGHHLILLVYDASKLSTVYVVKSPVLGLQRTFENSVFPPSVQSSLFYLTHHRFIKLSNNLKDLLNFRFFLQLWPVLKKYEKPCQTIFLRPYLQRCRHSLHRHWICRYYPSTSQYPFLGIFVQ